MDSISRMAARHVCKCLLSLHVIMMSLLLLINWVNRTNMPVVALSVGTDGKG